MGFRKTITTNWGGEREVLDIEKGVSFRNKYLETYPNLRQYMETMENQALTKGFVETLVGRRRHFKLTVPVYNLLKTANRDVDWFLDLPKKELETTNLDNIFSEIALYNILDQSNINRVDEKNAIRTWAFVRAIFKNELNNSKNFPIQGMGAHITNRGMLDAARLFKAKNLKAYVGLQVHDEITCYSEKKDTEAVVQALKDGMENNKFAKLLDIAMVADPLIAQTLKDAK
jgi:DNA polymerase-1